MKIKLFTRGLLAISLLTLPASLLAAGDTASADASSATEKPAVPEAVEATIEHIAPGASDVAIGPSVIPGLYEARVGPEVVYVTPDGRYVFQGNIVDLEAGVNITESVRKKARVAALSRVPMDNMIVFSPPEEQKRHYVSVFTDVDCPYCRKLHREIQQYVDAGIEVRYLAYPRAGVGSETFDTMVSVWCADDAREAITKAKAGQPVEQKECENPVQEQYELGQRVGVRGTPTIVTEDGTVVPGYVSADRLLGYLETPDS